MANLWRIMAIAWLGGFASPALALSGAAVDPAGSPTLSQPAEPATALIEVGGAAAAEEDALPASCPSAES